MDIQLHNKKSSAASPAHQGTLQRPTVESLMRQVPCVTPECSNEQVFSLFEQHPELNSIPVVKDGVPVGIISRQHMINSFARQYHRELYGRRPCKTMMDHHPVVVEKSASPNELSDLMLQSDPQHLLTGYIVTDNGHYAGMGSGHDLLRLITQMQISAARYANPLTMLPGNVPINEQIETLLHGQIPFVACYFDLDNFKPFNDVYGYKRGDDVIQLAGKLLEKICVPQVDFLGHIGGDDFIVLFQSPDWEERCQNLLHRFAEKAKSFYTDDDLAQGGIKAEDRQGKKKFHPLVSFSIGAVKVLPGTFKSHQEVSSAAAAAKKQAKKISGNSLFVERRE